MTRRTFDYERGRLVFPPDAIERATLCTRPSHCGPSETARLHLHAGQQVHCVPLTVPNLQALKHHGFIQEA